MVNSMHNLKDHNFFLTAPFTIQLPIIHFELDEMRVGGRSFTIKPGTDQSLILNYFSSDPGTLLERNILTNLLCPKSAELELRSTSHLESRWIRVVKIMSRLRQVLSERFFGMVPLGTEWLHYSPRRDGWILYRLPGLGSDGDFHT